MTPLTTCQDARNIVSEAVLAGDFNRSGAMTDLPDLVHTATTDLLVTTVAELHPTFEALHEGLRVRGLTHFERVARSADCADCDRIEGWHHTHMIAEGQAVNHPDAASQTLVRRGRLWRFSEARHASVKGNRWPLTFGAIFEAGDSAAQGAVR